MRIYKAPCMPCYRRSQWPVTVGSAVEGVQRAIRPTKTALDPVRARPRTAIQPVELIRELILHIFAVIGRAFKVA